MLRSKLQVRIRQAVRMRRLQRKADAERISVKTYLYWAMAGWRRMFSALRIRTSKDVFNEFYFRN